MSPRTLAMLKMEKNFQAHIEKGKPRFPYYAFSISFLLHRLEEELEELKQAWKQKDLEAMKLECADVSNLLDYVFERVTLKGS